MIPDNFDMYDFWEQEEARRERLREKEEWEDRWSDEEDD